MTTEQINLSIPHEIGEKILSGEYVRLGSVVRDTSGMQIVKMLDEVPVDGDDAGGLIAELVRSADTKDLALLLGALMLISGGIGTGIGWLHGRAQARKENEDGAGRVMNASGSDKSSSTSESPEPNRASARSTRDRPRADGKTMVIDYSAMRFCA